jgi:hypothetical protein
MTTEPVLSKESGSTADQAEANQKWGRFIDEMQRTYDTDILEWHRPLPIMLLLHRIARELRGLHWTTLPDGGGIEFTGASSGKDISLQLEVNDGRYVYGCSPQSLACVAIMRDSLESSYFDLELNRLEPLDKATGPSRQEKCRGTIRGVDFNEIVVEYTRLRCGRLIICSKGSPLYDIVRQDVHGRYNLMTRAQFRKFVESELDSLHKRSFYEEVWGSEAAVVSESEDQGPRSETPVAD